MPSTIIRCISLGALQICHATADESIAKTSPPPENTLNSTKPIFSVSKMPFASSMSTTLKEVELDSSRRVELDDYVDVCFILHWNLDESL